MHAPAADAPAAAGGQFTFGAYPDRELVCVCGKGNETLLNTSVAGDQLPAGATSGASPFAACRTLNGQAVAVWDDGNSGEVKARIVSA